MSEVNYHLRGRRDIGRPRKSFFLMITMQEGEPTLMAE